jgi:hypothetical protein
MKEEINKQKGKRGKRKRCVCWGIDERTNMGENDRLILKCKKNNRE